MRAGDQLERAGGDFLASTGHADDHRLTPAAVRTFQRGTHHVDVTDALKAMVHAPVDISTITSWIGLS